MKRCTQCGQVYADETLNFCLADGRPLVREDPAPTEVLTRSVPPAARVSRRIWLVFALLGGALMLTVVAGIAGAFIWQRVSRQEERAVVGSRPSPSPASTPERKPASVPTPSDPGPAANDEDEDVDSDPTPIGWETMASNFEGETGKTYRFLCPPGGVVSSVFGSEVYADYSSICTAAVHSGIIGLSDGGEVTVEYRPGRELYGSTERNGIKSYVAPKYNRSFVVR